MKIDFDVEVIAENYNAAFVIAEKKLNEWKALGQRFILERVNVTPDDMGYYCFDFTFESV